MFTGNDDAGFGHPEVRARGVAIRLKIKLEDSDQGVSEFFNPVLKKRIAAESLHLVQRQGGECRFVRHGSFAFIS